MAKILPLLLLVLTLGGCSSRNVQTDLEIVDVQTGWQDVSESGSESTKIVPGVSFRLRNVSSEPIDGVQITAVFRKNGDEAVIDDPFVRAIPIGASLEPGASSDVIVMRSKFGFTGTDTRSQLFKHSQFVDFNVRILGKHGRYNWAQMQTVDVQRVPLTRR